MMALPEPLPDNPMRWDGWKLFASANPYERLCLDHGSNPTSIQIESNCRQLLMWWQKKLPLKNQPSNPLAQLLRTGLDEAPAKLAEARTLLLDPESRARIDEILLAQKKTVAIAEFNKFLSFVLAPGELDPGEEENLYTMGAKLGLSKEDMAALVEEQLKETGFKRLPRKTRKEEEESAAVAQSTVASASANPREEFLRMLRLSELDDLTDDQRDAFCNMGEALGLSGGDAEDVIDEYLEEKMQAIAPLKPAPYKSPVPPVSKSSALAMQKKPEPTEHKPAIAPVIFHITPEQRAREKHANPDFINCINMPMLLVPSGTFPMGSDEPEAGPNESPVTKTNLTLYYISRWPVTNAQYEHFDPSHRSKRIPSAKDDHPVVYVSFAEAVKFCEWLSRFEKRVYRLPTEAEWEYAARGSDGRRFPWGNRLDSNDRANFADVNKRLPWSELTINCGFAETSPVGSFPRGASPFGMEDMAGNVWEWCLDCLAPYPGKERTNPRGPTGSPRQVYRGGSWKSRAASLRASARSSNSPAYSANDVGFRILCECGK